MLLGWRAGIGPVSGFQGAICPYPAAKKKILNLPKHQKASLLMCLIACWFLEVKGMRFSLSASPSPLNTSSPGPHSKAWCDNRQVVVGTNHRNSRRKLWLRPAGGGASRCRPFGAKARRHAEPASRRAFHPTPQGVHFEEPYFTATKGNGKPSSWPQLGRRSTIQAMTSCISWAFKPPTKCLHVATHNLASTDVSLGGEDIQEISPPLTWVSLRGNPLALQS